MKSCLYSTETGSVQAKLVTGGTNSDHDAKN